MRSAIALSLLVLSACASPSASMIGTWHHEGALKQDLGPVWTDITFTPDHKLIVGYIPGAGLAAGMLPPSERTKPTPKTTSFPYDDVGSGVFRIVQNGQALYWHAEVQGDKLFLRAVVAPGSGDKQAEAYVNAQAPTDVYDRVK